MIKKLRQRLWGLTLFDWLGILIVGFLVWSVCVFLFGTPGCVTAADGGAKQGVVEVSSPTDESTKTTTTTTTGAGNRTVTRTDNSTCDATTFRLAVGALSSIPALLIFSEWRARRHGYQKGRARRIIQNNRE